MEHAPLLINAVGGRGREARSEWSGTLPPPPGPGPALHHEHGAGAFGEKRIGFFGGMALIANNIFGPGLASLPSVFQQGGWLMCTPCPRPQPSLTS